MKKSAAILSILTISFIIIGFGVATAQIPQESVTAFAAEAVGTAITYQGYLEDADGPVTENCDFQFSVYGSIGGTDQFGSPQTHTNVWVENGYFTVQDLNFGNAIFQGDERYLEIAVSCPTGTGSYSTLNPRQPITPAPYALALPGLWTQPVSPSPNLIGGYSNNQVANDVFGATIGGGGSEDWGPNRVTDRFGTIAGGVNNQAGNDLGAIDISDLATVGGGGDNAAHGWAATIGGGYSNTITNTANAATIGGGKNNVITGDWTNTIGGGDSNIASGYWNATVAGGAHNTASESEATVSGGAENTASGGFASVGGGYQNNASGYGATVPGGIRNEANGSNSFAAGLDAKANHEGSFVWSDNTGEFSSSADNQFLISASGGVGIGTNEPRDAALAVTTAGNAMYLDGIDYGWLTFAGFNTYWDSTYTSWVARTDSVHNAGSLITSSWINGNLAFHTFDSSFGSGEFDQFVNLNNRMTIRGDTGEVQIANDLDVDGNQVIGGNLDVNGNYSWQAGKNFLMQGTGDFSFDFEDADGNDDWHVWAPNSPILTAQNDGNVGIGRSNPNFDLDVAGDINFTGDLYQNGSLFSGGGDICKWSGDPDIYYLGGNVGIGTSNPLSDLHIAKQYPTIRMDDQIDGETWQINTVGANTFNISQNGANRLWINNEYVNVGVLGIHGGSDLAEPFDIQGAENVRPGTVVSIDPENPGQLMIATESYDYKVAGCVSGANGINPGMVMGQDGTATDGEFPVALTGRVYCYADANYGAIQPGDLLTTSDTPGHLMAVKDYDQAQGSILGKAMERLESGQALILILVTLQ